MSSCGARTELRAGPLYFFDQPTRRNRVEGTRSHFYLYNVAPGGGAHEDTHSNWEDDSAEAAKRLTGEPRGEGKPEPDTSTSPAALDRRSQEPIDVYKRAAPLLLSDLALLLSQYDWAEVGRVPHGVANILCHSWQDLTSGAALLSSPEQTDKRRGSKGSLKLGGSPHHVSDDGRRQTGQGSAGPSESKPQVGANPRVKKRKQKSRACSSSSISFSISSSSRKDPAGCDLCPGWIVQPKQPSHVEPQQIRLYQWAVERLRAARNPERQQTPKLSSPLRLCHYGEAKAKVKSSRARRKSGSSVLVNGIPRIPEVKQPDPAQKKLHYRIDDGSSFIYYPSGCTAVCQSHSALPCGGFYTNVFSDSDCPVILATITAFGHGAVTHPHNSSLVAVWDQDGGFMNDHYGRKSQEWSWQTHSALKKKVVIQLSDLISVKLLNGTSATLSFRCNDESVQLPLPVLSHINQPKEMLCLQTDGKFTSNFAQDLPLARKTKSPVVVLENKRTLTPVSVGTQEMLQMVREVEGLEEPSARWRRAGPAGRELKRLQQRVRNTLDDWLDYYRAAVGIRCPDTEQMPDALLRTRPRREVQSAALPSLNPPERVEAKSVWPEESGDKPQEPHRHLSVRAERPADSSVRLPRTPKRRSKDEPRVTQIGPLQIHGNIQLESVIISKSPEQQPADVPRCPAPPPLTPSVLLSVCPVLLRAALLGEGVRRRCCCSVTLMPAVTDLEYDTFVMGQPPHNQQILVVCVTLPHEHEDALEQLYRRRNKHRSMPCTQCQMDSFRLVRYEMSTGGTPGWGCANMLLQQRHNAAPGMILMYIRRKLLFVGYMHSGRGCSVGDLQKQICRSRGDYRLGLSLPPHYKFSEAVNNSAATDPHNSQDAAMTGRDDVTLPASVEKKKANERKTIEVREASQQRQRNFCVKSKQTFPHVPLTTH
ncbi:uncharacterized protein C3orf20-like isoform X2 [Hippoglossus hippoglossus]|uniref:uncharacterized protein C3orf20-like isoform X2 n=1 Tax=Hippoglossus hippoglossus TaxID=8267 RepID=UPI00148C4B5A|nr:uncharacterized protein C3orf20-like isoform X2 [Hippoglossus hippoglossus]